MNTKTENPRDLGFLLSPASGNRSFDNGVIASGSGIVDAGTILGRVTADGKFKVCDPTETDGSEVAAAILGYRTDATSSDADAAVVTRDAELIGDELIYGSAIDNETKKATARDQLAAVGLITR